MGKFFKTANILTKLPKRNVNNIIYAAHEYMDKIKWLQQYGHSNKSIAKADEVRTMLHNKFMDQLREAQVNFNDRYHATDMAMEISMSTKKPSRMRKLKNTKQLNLI